MIHIITPCSRPENLEHLRETIPAGCTWTVFMDYSTSKKDVPKGVKVIRSNLGGAWGHPLRNLALDYLQASASDNDYVYFLDDDNIIHPKWFEAVKDSKEDFINWAQCFRNGDPRLYATDHPRIGNVDTASYMVRIGFIGRARFEYIYEGDGLFAQALMVKSPSIKTLNNYLCYYNYLR
jgi:glycosyltransferase involved in cell wall biosynthesis